MEFSTEKISSAVLEVQRNWKKQHQLSFLMLSPGLCASTLDAVFQTGSVVSDIDCLEDRDT